MNVQSGFSFGFLLFSNSTVYLVRERCVAANDGRCSEVEASFLRQGGHPVDAAVSTALCLGVVNPLASGIGGGAFMIVRSSSNSKTEAFDSRETAPLAASENMYADNPKAKLEGALSMGVPGEIAGLYEAWLKYGRLSWRNLFQPAIKFAKDGFIVAPYLGQNIMDESEKILNDPGLRQVYAPKGKLLQVGDICYSVELGHILEEIAQLGPKAFYNGTVGEKFVKDVREAGGILTMGDLRNYRVEVTDTMAADVMGYTIYGMPPPSSGTFGAHYGGCFVVVIVMNILDGYGNPDAAKGSLGLHRLIEAMKHMFAIRMNLGDPHFVNISTFVSDMLSPDLAKKIRDKIFDNTTFPPEYYMYRFIISMVFQVESAKRLWNQPSLHCRYRSKCCVNDNHSKLSFGGRVLSTSTGIVLNNEMGDFSIPTEMTVDGLPPAPNFIRPYRSPLSSMTPLIVTKDNHLAGVLGGSGGMKIMPAVAQVFLSHFFLGMDPLSAVNNPRVYHQLIPNVVLYENFTVFNGNHIEVSDETKLFLQERGHQVETPSRSAITQLVVQSLGNPIKMDQISGKVSNAQIFHGTLTAVRDPRKDGKPAAI
ncbi:hypothetical protein FEM48_Zijuj12G0146200 [Ziziphus jujuba var. spinosa]|uniref:Glutathione hydrolase n=1 Tax=Ziziphus jujuba var. spinosa TaxID=714518 RepID=A0A978UDX1_ZIZJJ|nr:hypothetical protein FEM48_Zijuj12G0146200 [Ziziphus jujuba var. spinosa]